MAHDQPRSQDAADLIVIRGARTHNLKNVDLDLPRDKLVVFTGVSGSGKSSLAFDTIFAEGQRRFLECLAEETRPYLDQVERPDVDQIDGLPPTVAIDQRGGRPNPRSTVGTITEILDYLRLLYARLGTPHCPRCGKAVLSMTPDQMVEQVLGYPEGRRVMVLAPLVRRRKGEHRAVFEAIRRAGLIRARVDGQIIEVADEPKLAKSRVHSIEAVVDRLVVREGVRSRLAESIGLALKLSDGVVTLAVETESGWAERLLSIRTSCLDCGQGLASLEPGSFSFNNPRGACPRCQGLGSISRFRPERVLDTSQSLDSGAVVPWSELPPGAARSLRNDPSLGGFLAHHAIAGNLPVAEWPPGLQTKLLEGDPETGFPGLLARLEAAYLRGHASVRKGLGVFREELPCSACGGSRLGPEARAVRVGERSIGELCDLPVEDLARLLESMSFEPHQRPVADLLLGEILVRARCLVELGLGYLSLARGSETLSGGELQRARLATQLGAGLVGVCYVLDEPTSGLHARDTERLIATLRRLRDQGNSLVVVEHDEAVIRAADWVVDLGPGAGPDGGSVVAMGAPEDLALSPNSLTAKYLSPKPWAFSRGADRRALPLEWIRIRGASVRNLKGVEVSIPLGALTCVSGVSGSGKSSLVHDVLASEFRRRCLNADQRPVAEIHGLEAIGAIVEVDQAPIGRSPRSTPATFTGAFQEIRRVFAATRQARLRGFGAARFSFNARASWCERCQGQGRRRLPTGWLSEFWVVCEACQGKRFNPQILEIRFKGRSIGDVLELRVDEAIDFFEAQTRVLPGLKALQEVGLGYLTLGQPGTTLSGGEAQRVKLAAQLAGPRTGRTLYLLDEPTTGLHFDEVERLLRVLHRLADGGNTVVVIEHNLRVIAGADWVIDLGPEAGEAGGRLMAAGPPEIIAATSESWTGRFLKPFLDPVSREAATDFQASDCLESGESSTSGA